jgi:hypothetical protein
MTVYLLPVETHLPSKQKINRYIHYLLEDFISEYKIICIVPFLTFIHKHYGDIQYSDINPEWIATSEHIKFSDFLSMLQLAPPELDAFVKVIIPMLLKPFMQEYLECWNCGQLTSPDLLQLRHVLINKPGGLELLKITFTDEYISCLCLPVISHLYVKAMEQHKYEIVTYLRSIDTNKDLFHLTAILRMNVNITKEDVQFMINEFGIVIDLSDVCISSLRDRSITGYLLTKYQTNNHSSSSIIIYVTPSEIEHDTKLFINNRALFEDARVSKLPYHQSYVFDQFKDRTNIPVCTYLDAYLSWKATISNLLIEDFDLPNDLVEFILT